MPNRPKSPCTQPGCGELTDGGKCERHSQQARRESDHERGNAHQRGYGIKWQQYREHWLREFPLCGMRRAGPSAEHSECWRSGRAIAATDVDHITPHRGDQRLFWDQDNHQSLCHTCHSKKTAREDGGFGRDARARTT